MSREYLFSLVVSDHDPGRADAIAAAVTGWLNEGASEELPVRRSALNDGALAFKFQVGMGGGWPATGSAKSVSLQIGQANGGSCRVEWAAWLLDMPQVSLELPGERTVVAPIDDALAGPIDGPDCDADGAARPRRFFVQITVSGPRDPAAVMTWLRTADDWTDDPHGHGFDADTFVEAALALPVGHTLRAHAERWLAALEAGYGDRVELRVDGSDLGQPTESRVFEPDSFPLHEPGRPIEPKNWFATTMPLGTGPDRCGYCASAEGLRRLEPWALAEVQTLVEENVARWSSRGLLSSRFDRPSSPSICRPCLATILTRLVPAAGIKSGLFETDGNPFGAADRPDLPCMTCATPATEEIVVLNHNLTFGVCRACLRGAASDLEAAYARATQRKATSTPSAKRLTTRRGRTRERQ